jgi:HD-like signal output (HDOD) protein
MSGPHVANLAGWTTLFLDAEIPVLDETRKSLQALRRNVDRVDAAAIADVVINDPLMILKVLAHVSRNRPKRLMTDAESVTASVLIMGVPPFFRVFDTMTTVEEQLADHPDALDGVWRVIRRARRAASFAYSFALMRKDGDAVAIRDAAMLHEFAELLLWCHAPDMAYDIRRLQAANARLRSKDVQKHILGIELSEVEHELMIRWKLPELLVALTDHGRQSESRVKNVMLAIQLARHSEDGWANAALPDDYKEIGALLGLSAEAAKQRISTLE